MTRMFNINIDMFRYNLKKRIRGFKLEVAYFLKRVRTAIKYGKIGWNITDWDYRSLLELEKTNLEEIYEYYKDLIGVTRHAKWLASKIATLISVINILLEISNKLRIVQYFLRCYICDLKFT